MSRASDLRDEIICQLRSKIGSVPSERITAFLIPDFEKDELAEPRIGVRIGRREIDEQQGAAERMVVIEIGVMGLTEHTDPMQPTTLDGVRGQMLKAADDLDALMEDVIALWSPRGPLSFGGHAGHSFYSISQPYAFDPKQLYANHVWLSIIALTYRDCIDD